LRVLGENSGERYEQLRRRLLVYFGAQRHAGAEEAADETLDRAARRLAEGVEVTSVESFVLGIARNVVREGWKRPRVVEVDWRRMASPEAGAEEPALDCLDRCLERLAPASRSWVERFYAGEGGVKIRARAALAAELGIDANALRVRMHRVRGKLEACVRACLAGNETDAGAME
jgi:DNA-directed RNA polymerase specialized sigma24 family protein